MPETFEQSRLAALHRLKLLDSPTSESFDRITRMASRMFDLPVAAVSLTDSDRQWFKSRVGVEHDTLARHKAPCSQVAVSGDVLVVPDLALDPDYCDSPLSEGGIRFYAGAPLMTRDGYGLGALCVLGADPRAFSPAEVRSLQDMAAMVMSQIELQHAFGRLDPVTGLPNRVQLDEDLADLTRDRTARPGRRMFALIDVATGEQLGQLGRAKGHAYLDELMRTTVRILEAMTSSKLYHVGSGQFAVVSGPGLDEAAYVDFLAKRLSRLGETNSHRFVLTTAVGVVPFELGVDAENLVRHACNAAEHARTTERRVALYSRELDRQQGRKLRLVDDFASALERPDELRLAFQPRIELSSGRTVGVEALLRWRHPELGDVSPGEFIPLIEHTDLARPTTTWVLEAALDQMVQWRRAGLTLRVSVNVSASNLQELDFADRVLATLKSHRLSSDVLELELTESAFLADTGRAQQHMQRLTDAGVTLAIDDFGTGYSSLSYLQSLPAQVVKVDQSFVRDVVGDERKRTLVASTISLAQSLGYTVVAEGVETPEVAALLTEVSCNQGQGYFWGRPMNAQDIERALSVCAVAA